MTTQTMSVKGYVVILGILIALTILTVSLSLVRLPPPWHVGAGFLIAVVKATLVVLFFMHALHSPRLTWCIIVAAIAWLVILFSLTCADYMTRLMIPYSPGH